jgi:mono/diheme cytochrome c family protein
MTATPKCGLRPRRLLLLAILAALGAGAGCRQRMADQPYYRPLDESDFFADHRSARPLERGVVHRGQRLDADPVATGLTADEWARAYKYEVPASVDAKTKAPATLTEEERKERSVGAPRYDQRAAGQPKVFAESFPFQITADDLKRGQERFTIYCAACHGPYGNGQGKIWERGYLNPTSFHTHKVAPNEADVTNPQGLGISRGYSLWGIHMPMTAVPPGYIFEVMTKGYGGMPSYSAQVPPEDRWRIVAYIRVLQMSQTDPAKLPPEAQKLLPGAGGKK